MTKTNNSQNINIDIPLYSKGSINDILLKEMIPINEDSFDYLYSNIPVISPNIISHPLYEFAQKFKKETNILTINEVQNFVYGLTEKWENNEYLDLIIGGYEIDIINRGSNIPIDLSRTANILLQCLNIPSRIVHVVADISNHREMNFIEVYDNDDSWIVILLSQPLENMPKLQLRDMYNMTKSFGQNLQYGVNEYNIFDRQYDYTENIIKEYKSLVEGYINSNMKTNKKRNKISIQSLLEKFKEMNKDIFSPKILINNFYKMLKIKVESSSDDYLFEIINQSIISNDLCYIRFARQLEVDNHYYQISLKLNYKNDCYTENFSLWVVSKSDYDLVKIKTEELINKHEFIDYSIDFDDVE